MVKELARINVKEHPRGAIDVKRIGDEIIVTLQTTSVNQKTHAIARA